MILRDREGSIIFSSCRHLHTCTDVLETELLALKEGISLALQWSNLPIDIKSDCLEAIMMVKAGVGNKSKHAFMIREIIINIRILALLILVRTVVMLVTSWLFLVGCNAKLRFG